MEKEDIVLFTIYERTMIKHKFCAMSNILQNIVKYNEFNGLDKGELKNSAIQITGKLMESSILSLDYNSCAHDDKNLLCFAINSGSVDFVEKKYAENIQNRFDSLDDDAKKVLFDIYFKQRIKREPYILSELNEEQRRLFDKSIQSLEDTVFVQVKDTYHIDTQDLKCENAVVSVSGKVACEINMVAYEKTKMEQENNLEN